MEFDLFAKGLAEGLLEGGQDTLKELGPFLTHLVFHPIDTAEELLNALYFLLTKALELNGVKHLYSMGSSCISL